MMYSSNSVENNKDNGNNDFRDSISREKMSRSQEVDLVPFPFFYFLFYLFSFFLFLAFKVSDNTGYMIYRRVWKDDIIPHTDLMANTWLFRVG